MVNFTSEISSFPQFDSWANIVPVLDNHPTGALLLILLILAMASFKGKLK